VGRCASTARVSFGVIDRRGRLLFPPCEEGVKGGGPVSFDCTGVVCLARSIDEVDDVCASSSACMLCRLRVSLRANGEHTDDAEVVWPTPPCPPLHKGGKLGAAARMCATKTLLRRSTFQPSHPQFCTTPASPPRSCDNI
jgi:hypothetical protein